MTKSFFRNALCSSTALIAAAALAAPAVAQTDTDDEVALQPQGQQADVEVGQPIVITGSRIARPQVDSAAPVAVVEDEEFQLSGAVNVEQVINTLPQVIPGTTSFSNNPGGGVATLDLRGLGEERTAVLVNGRRYMFFDTSQVVDLNTIPQFLIESVDVVTGGASAVYGSDAIAGVVNFKLRNDLQGLLVGAQSNITQEGDGHRYNAYVALGGDINDGRGHATVYAEYYNRKEIFQGDRDYTRFALGDGDGELVPGGSSTLPAGVLYYNGDSDTDLTGTDFGAGVVFDAPGDFRPRAGDLYNYAPANYLQVPQERYLLGGYADYEFSEGHTAYAEFSFVNNRVPNELAATPVTGSFDVNLDAVGQFLNPEELAQLELIDSRESGEDQNDGIVPLFIQRRVIETGSRNTLDERNAFRALIGARGDISGPWGYDAYYLYARTRNANVQAGNVSRSAFQAGLLSEEDPINIFGPGTLSQQDVDQISILAQNGDISELQVANAAITGNFGGFGLGGGEIGLAFGAEYRKVSSEFVPDTALASGDVIGFNAGEPTAGSYDVKELFAELYIPIIAYAPGIERLDITAAGRYSDYSLDAVGGVWTYAGGVEYSPITDVTLRGQYQRAVRAPNVGELFGGLAQGFPPATDPCGTPAALTDSTLRSLCIATGVPDPAVDPGSPLGTIGTTLGNTQIQGVFGGNPDLAEETSESWTAGVVLEPRFLPGFTLTVDYFDIKVEDAISTFGGGLNNTLNLCYNVIQDADDAYCQVAAAARNNNGVFDGVNPLEILNANIATLETSGVDLQAAYGMDLTDDLGLNLSFLGTWTEKSDFTPVADLPDDVNECAGTFGLTCGEPTPEWKWTSRASLLAGPVTTSVRWRHLSGVDDDNVAVDYVVDRLSSYDLIDFTLSMQAFDTATFTLGVNNVFDKEPELIGDNQEQANTYPGTYDVLGRDFFFSISAEF